MEINEKLSNLRAMTDAADGDDILLSFIQQAGDVILTRMYPYKTDDELDALKVPKKFEWKQIQIAAFLLNKRGAEGETQHIENGIHRNYKYAYVPEDMLYDVLPQVGIPR